MRLIHQFYNYIENLDRKIFKRYITIFSVIIVLICSLIVFNYFRKSANLHKKITFINKKRREVKELLERFEIVKKQQATVDAILEKDQDFKIGGYFDTVVRQLNITKNKTREPETSSDELDNGYTEIKLYASFNNMSTEGVVRLLDTLEQNERIYTKEVEIYKVDNNGTVNLNILIATLEPKSGLPIVE